MVKFFSAFSASLRCILAGLLDTGMIFQLNFDKPRPARVSEEKWRIYNNRYNKARFRETACHLKPASLLEVGCEYGVLGYLLDGTLNYVGLDVDKESVEISRSMGNLTYVGSAFDLPFPDSSYDNVVLEETLEHCGHAEVVIKEAYRVLAPGGVLVLSIPAKGKMRRNPDHHYFYKFKAMKSLITNAGFRIIKAFVLMKLFSFYVAVKPEDSYVPTRLIIPMELHTKKTLAGRLFRRFWRSFVYLEGRLKS